MALLACTLDCIAGGFSKVTLSFSAVRTGSNNDRYEMRIARKQLSNNAVVILPGTPRFTLRSEESVYTFCWLDPGIPADGDYQYTLQIRRIEGLGDFNEMNLIAEHFKK